MERTVDYKDGIVSLINQKVIPQRFEFVAIDNYKDLALAIKDMTVRGAPAIGVSAALGVVLAAKNACGCEDELFCAVDEACKVLRGTRPTAVNLFWGIECMRAEAEKNRGRGCVAIVEALEKLGRKMIEADENACKAIGRNGSELLGDTCTLLTNCNAGSLACVSYGTALGVVRAAHESGKNIKVFSCETRPRLQGMKLTCFELLRDGIDVTGISDNMAGSLMREGRIDAVIVGADRIAANGDTANKIGTYPLAVLAKYHNIPFYVAAPVSTIDFSLSDGSLIPIEEREHTEMTHVNGSRIAPVGLKVINPAFDVTPASLISAVITEKGVVRNPQTKSMKVLK